MNKKKIVPIAKGDPKMWVSLGPKLRVTDQRTVFKKLCNPGALFIRQYISIKMNLQALAALEF